MNNNLFKAFVGLSPKIIKSRVIISPMIYPNRLKLKGMRSQLGFVSANAKNYTFIKCPQNPELLADLVTLLGKTRCKEILLAGAIGALLDRINIGDVISSNKVYSTPGILWQTRKNLLKLRKNGYVGIDLESMALFKTAKKSKLKVQSIYVVTDLPLKKPFYKKLSNKDAAALQKGLDLLIKKIEEFGNKDE